jgi:hypothetical protein
VEAVVRRDLPVVIAMIGLLIFGLPRRPRPADAQAEPPLTAAADTVEPAAADGPAANDPPRT